METDEAKVLRGMVASLNYLTQDTPDLQYPAKEVSREMARPRKRGLEEVKKGGEVHVGEEGGGVEV